MKKNISTNINKENYGAFYSNSGYLNNVYVYKNILVGDSWRNPLLCFQMCYLSSQATLFCVLILVFKICI